VRAHAASPLSSRLARSSQAIRRAAGGRRSTRPPPYGRPREGRRLRSLLSGMAAIYCTVADPTQRITLREPAAHILSERWGARGGTGSQGIRAWDQTVERPARTRFPPEPRNPRVVGRSAALVSRRASHPLHWSSRRTGQLLRVCSSQAANSRPYTESESPAS
jgi:hypothetical protein